MKLRRTTVGPFRVTGPFLQRVIWISRERKVGARELLSVGLEVHRPEFRSGTEPTEAASIGFQEWLGPYWLDEIGEGITQPS